MIENTEKFELREMPEDEAIEIFKAWRNGEKIEVYEGAEVWHRIESIAHTLIRPGIYRIPVRPPSFYLWQYLPEWARYVAQDQCGETFIYENEPAKTEKVWGLGNGEAMEITNFRLGYNPGTGGWENSMIEKPEGV